MERLKRRSDFRTVADGVRVPGSAFVLQARRRTDGGGPRVGLTVSRQVGNAVERNRVRRRLRELVRLSVTGGAGSEASGGSGPLHAGYDYVLVGRRPALAARFVEMIRELDAALGRVHRVALRGTGDGGRGLLHEASSRSWPRASRRTRLNGPTEHPPQER